MTTNEKIAALRQSLAAHRIHAYVVGSADPHQNEYVAPRFQSRAWLSGFAGSAGTAVVTGRAAGLWVDSRYWLEAEAAVAGSEFQLFRLGMPGVPDPAEWLAATLGPGETAAYDASCASLAFHRELARQLERRGAAAAPGPDLIDPLWTDRPALPDRPVADYLPAWSGSVAGEKLARAEAWLQERSIHWHLVSATDQIAWLLDLRGSDVDYNPVFYAWLLLGQYGHVLFVDQGRLGEASLARLADCGVALAPYHAVGAYLQTLPAGDAILLPPESTNMQLWQSAVHLRRPAADDPVPAWKAVKTPAEQAALRACLARDGAALARFWHWLAAGPAGGEERDEASIGARIAACRADDPLYRGESFPPIVGWNGHGAIVHYRAPERGSAAVAGPGILLVDCGAQYEDGTSDLTRVVAFGPPDPLAVKMYTLVLKGHVALATAVFPQGTRGAQLDVLARQALWREGCDYGHGTGHGIGFYLNVHEGPQRIAPSPAAMAAPLEAGNLISNEPGYYLAERFGIRIENMLLVRADPDRQGFLGFDTVSLAPFERELIDLSRLDAAERAWIDAYHARVEHELAPLLDKAAAAWLRGRTRPL